MAAAATKRLLADLKYMGVGAVGGGALSFFFDVCQVKGRSMLPHLSEEEGDYVLVSKYKFPTRGLERGGVYTFWSPDDPEKTIIKRVIGKEGDRFSYYKRGFRDLVTVPTGHVWVEGDNKPLSEDSRYYGPIPAGLARGSARCVVWPPSRWRLLACLPDAVSPAAVAPAAPCQDRWEEAPPWGSSFVEEEEEEGGAATGGLDALGEGLRSGGGGGGGAAGADAPASQPSPPRPSVDGASSALPPPHALPAPPPQSEGGATKGEGKEGGEVVVVAAAAAEVGEEGGDVLSRREALAAPLPLPPSPAADEVSPVSFSSQTQTNRSEK